MRRGNNVEGRGFPGCRDGGWKNPEKVTEEEFARRWEMAFGRKSPAGSATHDVQNGSK